MGDRGRQLLGLAGLKSDRASGVDEERASGAPAGGRAHEDDEDSEGKRAAVEELHAALGSAEPDHGRAIRALEDFHDLHAAGRGQKR